jgi:hypothetical protein
MNVGAKSEGVGRIEAYSFERITPMATVRCSFAGSFARARSAARRVLNDFESGLDSPPTYLKSTQRSVDFIWFL